MDFFAPWVCPDLSAARLQGSSFYCFSAQAPFCRFQAGRLGHGNVEDRSCFLAESIPEPWPGRTAASGLYAVYSRRAGDWNSFVGVQISGRVPLRHVPDRGYFPDFLPGIFGSPCAWAAIHAVCCPTSRIAWALGI